MAKLFWEEGRPLLLDLFCGGGGCSYGYWLAGWNVIGVDMNPQPNYPFKFIQGDALEFPLDGYDAIHASPPCQGYSTITKMVTKWAGKERSESHPKLIIPIRKRLQSSGVPWVMENVVGGNEIKRDLMLCGTMFDLKVYRHRIFELSHHIPQPIHPPHIYPCPPGVNNPTIGVHFHCVAGHFKRKDYAYHAMGWDEGECWMNAKQLAQSIPPNYCEYIGHYLKRHIRKS